MCNLSSTNRVHDSFHLYLLYLLAVVTLSMCNSWSSQCSRPGKSIACGGSNCTGQDERCCADDPPQPVCATPDSGVACGYGGPPTAPFVKECDKATDCPQGDVCCAACNKEGCGWLCYGAAQCPKNTSIELPTPTTFRVVCQADCDCPAGQCTLSIDDSGVTFCQ